MFSHDLLSPALRRHAFLVSRELCLDHRFLVKVDARTRKTSLTTVIFVSRASVSLGYMVGETEGSGSSNYRMSVNHGHPGTYA